ncbi:MAG: tetratricopeptide repeat protein [Kineosporiaceae bacterium]|nr:tetratricopeptide repeat protein [Kineosporiaceae bacterium]
MSTNGHLSPSDVLAILESRARLHPGGFFALITFLELAAHRLGDTLNLWLHDVSSPLARRLGLLDEARLLCREIIGESPFTSGLDSPSQPPDPNEESDESDSDRTEESRAEESMGPDVGTASARTAPNRGGSVPQVMGGVPHQNPFFVGRDDQLADLAQTLEQRGQATVTAVHGLGGIGKSQLAAEYAHRYQSNYEMIWWIPSDDPRSVRRSFVSLARRLGMPEAADVQLTVDTLLDRLRQGKPHARWLLIFDAAQRPADLQAYIPSGPGHVLVTSRDRTWSGASNALELDVFTPQESVAFLAHRWPELSETDAATLADNLGHWPLALEQAAAVHAETGMPLAEYLHLLETKPAQLMDEGEAPYYPTSVAKTLHLAFEKLTERSEAAAQLLEVCCFMSSNPISVPMLARGRGAASLPTALSETLRDDMKMRGAIRDIGRYALAKLDPSRDFITIHMLITAVLRANVPAARKASVEQCAHEMLALANPGQPDSRRNWSQFAQIAPHVRPSGVIHSEDPHVRRIVLDLARYYYATGDYEASAAVALEAVENWQARLGSDDHMTLAACFHAGNAQRELGEYMAARQINSDTWQRLQASDSAGELTLRVANSSGADHRLAGDFRRAMEIDEENLAQCRRTLGDDDPLTLRSANNLAVDCRLLGDFTRALELDMQTLATRQVVLGPLHHEVLLSTVNLIRDHAYLGHYELGLADAREAIDRFEPALPEHPQMWFMRRNLASLLRLNGNYHDSLIVATGVYDQLRRRYGPRNENTMAAALTLFNSLRATNRLDEAQTLGEETLDAYTAQLGAEHPFTLACASNLAVLYRALSRIDEAYERDRVTQDALHRRLGSDHPYSLVSDSNMSNNLALREEVDQALTLSEATYAAASRIRGDDHPFTLACGANLALDLEAVGRHDEAGSIRAAIHRGLLKRLGPEHPETVNFERRRRSENSIEVPRI